MARLSVMLILMELNVNGKIEVLDGFICAMAEDQWELGERLDVLVKMVLDEGLHSGVGVF